jgi:predicted RNase H-like nuclease
MTWTTIIGFDSAWANNPKQLGAICAISIGPAHQAQFIRPELASFETALNFISSHQNTDGACLVALDQPTIVPNQSGCRPVDRVAASLVSFIGGGVQPANRGKKGLFDDRAPIWQFKRSLGAAEEPEEARSAEKGLYLIEVFPALALPALSDAFCTRLGGPRYNPARRRTYRDADWRAVASLVAAYGRRFSIASMGEWAEAVARLPSPTKPDQDRLDAALCALIGHHWRYSPRGGSIMIGDGTTGYMVAPASLLTRDRLERAAVKHGVRIDGKIELATMAQAGF